MNILNLIFCASQNFNAHVDLPQWTQINRFAAPFRFDVAVRLSAQRGLRKLVTNLLLDLRFCR